MRFTRRPASERGRTRTDWLDSRHSFSFGSYQDPAHTAFRSLRVINDDLVAPGRGFAQHGHRDAEIFSYVLAGRLEHRDSLGNGRVIETGDVQYMSAGRGVLHSEFNPSATEPVRFLQVWLMPNVTDVEPGYADKRLSGVAEQSGRSLLFSQRSREGSIGIRADADVFLWRGAAGERLDHTLSLGRGAWIHVVNGSIEIAGLSLDEGDGAAIEDCERLEVSCRSQAEFLLFDLA